MSERPPARAVSLRWKLPLIVVGLMMVVVVATLAIAARQVQLAARRAAAERLAEVTTEFASRLRAELRGHALRSAAVARDPRVRAAFSRPQPAAFPEALLGDTSLLAAALVDRAGGMRWSGGPSGAALGQTLTADPRTLLAGGDSVGIGGLVAVGDTMAFPSVATVTDGAVAVGYVVQWHAIRPDARAREVVATVVGSGARVYIGTPGGGWTDQAGAVAPPPQPIESLGRSRVYARPGAGDQLAFGSSVAGAPWAVVTEFPLVEVEAPVRSFLDRAVLLGSIVLLTGAGLTAMLSHRLIGPLLDLTAATDAMAAGDHARRVTVSRSDEVGRLGRAFNAMVERVEAEVASRLAAEDQWRLLFTANPHPMWVFDLDTLGFLAVNDAAIARYGWSREEFLRMSILEIRPPEDAGSLRTAIPADVGQVNTSRPWRHRDREGKVFDVEVSSRGVAFDGRPARLVLASDVSARTALERQLRQAQKMEAVGRLAGGVAHDFNNNLAVIVACAEMLQDDLRASGQETTAVDEILHASSRATTLTRQLLAFSRQQVTHPTVLDPNEAVRDVERLARRIIGEDVVLRLQLADDAARVRIDPGQLEQVLLNLLVNARDAMLMGGEIIVATTRTVVDEESRALHGLTRAGEFGVISVSDTGTGMVAEVRARLFEPFFTTKAVGKGTGLGLATAYGIIATAGGAITVYSEPGVGSTFRIYLPVAGHGEEGSRPSAVPPAEIPRGTERVLLVEDDDAVRSVTKLALHRLGYQVIEAPSPAAALALADDPAQHFDAVLTDVVMPAMSGVALVDRLRMARPGLPALLMSGYAGSVVEERGVVPGGLPFLEKPFTMESLSRALRRVLDA